MKKVSLGLTLLLVMAACSQGYTQEEVDSIVADAVEEAVADAENEFISGAEAQAQADEPGGIWPGLPYAGRKATTAE